MFIVFDIGGTKMRLGSSRDGETLDNTAILKTPASYEEGIAELKKHAIALAGGEPIDAVAGGLAGTYSQKKSSLIHSSNLSDWVDRPIRTELETFFNAPAYIENDASLGGLGEALHGAGKGFGIVAYMTVSTGIGGSRIVHGRIDQHALGFEPGHQIIDADRSMIPHANGIFIEDYISGTALTRRTNKSPKDIQEPAFWDGVAKVLAYGLQLQIKQAKNEALANRLDHLFLIEVAHNQYRRLANLANRQRFF
jgi:glucokinase